MSMRLFWKSLISTFIYNNIDHLEITIRFPIARDIAGFEYRVSTSQKTILRILMVLKSNFYFNV